MQIAKKRGNGNAEIKKGNAIPGKKRSIFYNDPNVILVPGVDSQLKDHYLSENKGRVKIDEAMVKNIRFHGIIEPITVTKEGDRMIVVAGRRRVVHAREANRLNDQEGSQLLSVPCVYRRGEEKLLLGISASENSIRKAPSVMDDARKAEAMSNYGASPAEIALSLGCDEWWVQQLWKLLELDKRVLQLVDKGDIAATAALTLHGLSGDEQYETAMKIIESGEKPTIRRVKEASGKTVAPTKTLVKKVVMLWRENRDDPPVSDDFVNGAMWAKGLLSAEDAEIEDLLNSLKKKKKAE